MIVEIAGRYCKSDGWCRMNEFEIRWSH